MGGVASELNFVLVGNDGMATGVSMQFQSGVRYSGCGKSGE